MIANEQIIPWPPQLKLLIQNRQPTILQSNWLVNTGYIISIFYKQSVADNDVPDQQQNINQCSFTYQIITPSIINTKAGLDQQIFQTIYEQDISRKMQYYEVPLFGVSYQRIWVKVKFVQGFILVSENMKTKIVSIQFFRNADQIQKYSNEQIIFGFWTDSESSYNIILSIYTQKNGQFCILYPHKKEISSDSELQMKCKLLKFIENTQTSKNYQTHQLLVLSNATLILVHNIQLLIYEAMILTNPSSFTCVLMQITSIQRPKHPLIYYKTLYQSIHKLTIPISLESKLKLVQYCLIENIPVEKLLNKINQEQLRRQEVEKTVDEIKKIDGEILENDPISPTVMFYWMIGIPGSGKQKIYEELDKNFAVFEAKRIFLTQKDQIDKSLQQFLGQKDLFKVQRFAFIFIEIRFSEDSLSSLIQSVEEHLSENFNYQIYLISPQLKNAHQFLHDQLPDSNSYCFSLDFIIAVLLNALKQTSSFQLNGNSTDKIAKMLYHISSRYCNLNIQRVIKESKGNVHLIQYEPECQISWQEYAPQFKSEIQEQLSILLESSYKQQIREDPLLWYFLQNIEQIQYQLRNTGVGEIIIEKTFCKLPLFDFFHSI